MVRRFLVQNLSYANVVATLALVLAVTGGAYAATQLPKNSVGSKQVKDSSLKAKDFKAGQLPAGAPGPKGKDGAAGPNVLTVGSKHGEYADTVSACTSYHFLGGHFTVPRAAALHVDSTLGFRVGATQNVQSELFLIDIHDGTRDPVARTGYTVTWGTTQVNPVLSGLMTVNGQDDDPFALLPGHTYELELVVFDPFGGSPSCSGTAQVTRPTIQWMAFPFPSAG